MRNFIKFMNMLEYNTLSLPTIVVGPEASNGTGYFDPLMHRDFGMQRMLFIDMHGRRGMIIPLSPCNNVVIFQRYRDNNRIFVTNGLDCAFPSSISEEHQWQMVINLIEVRKIDAANIRRHFGNEQLYCSVTPESIEFYTGRVTRRLAELNALL